MKYSLIKKQMALAVLCTLGLGAVSGASSAQTNTDKRGYLTDTRGEVVRSGYGLCWRTGSWTPALAIAECDPDLMPAPKAAAPVPKPVAAVVPAPAPKPAAQRVTLDADTLFDFDKAVLRPAGKTALDDFVAKTRDISPEVILAVGHADRFGSEPYNQNLSERRAATVKNYLLGLGVDANRVKTEGRGETQPKTKAGECTGAKSAKVIACLQPDRRVDVEIVGTRIVR
jgi:OOP family OmpA-OmpF porin